MPNHLIRKLQVSNGVNIIKWFSNVLVLDQNRSVISPHHTEFCGHDYVTLAGWLTIPSGFIIWFYSSLEIAVCNHRYGDLKKTIILWFIRLLNMLSFLCAVQMPKVQYRSNCKPSTFAYPPALEVPKEKEKEKVSLGLSWSSFKFCTFMFFLLCHTWSWSRTHSLRSLIRCVRENKNLWVWHLPEISHLMYSSV